MLLSWSPCSTGTDHGDAHALPRFGHTCSVIDATATWGTDLCVVFGGVRAHPGVEQHAATADVHVLTADGADAWFKPQVTGPAPSPRAFHAACTLGQSIYVFGGHVLSTEEDQKRRKRTFFNELWRLDTETWTWQLLTSASSEAPPKRDMCSLTPLGDEALIVFGGRNEAGRTTADTWLFDIATQQWLHLKAGGVPPAPRKMHAAVHVNGRMLLFGGERDNGVLDDLWSLKLPPAPLSAWLPQHLAQQAHAGAPLLAHAAGQGDEICRWTQIRVRPAPTARFGHSLNLSGGRMLAMFGGCHDTAGFLALTHAFVQCSELWVLDLASFSWHKHVPDGPVTSSGRVSESGAAAAVVPDAAEAGDVQLWPCERMCHSMAALSDGRMLLLGGRRKDGICTDAWWLHMQSTPGLPQAAGATATSTRSSSQSGAADAAAAPTATSPGILKSLFNPLRPSIPTPIAPPVPQVSYSGDAAAAAAAAGNLHSPGDQSAVSSSNVSLSASVGSKLGELTSTTALTTTAAMSKLTGKLLGSRGPETGAVSAEEASAASANPAWLPSMPGTATQLLGKLTGLTSKALPGRQQAQPAPGLNIASNPGLQALPLPLASGQLQYSQPAPGQQQYHHQPGYGVPGPAGRYETGGSLDQASAMAVQAAADAAELEAFREAVLHLPAVPPSSALSSRASPGPGLFQGGADPPGRGFDLSKAQAVLALLQQRGRQLSEGACDPHAAVSIARSHLSRLAPDEVTLQDFDLIAQDYKLLAQSRAASKVHARPGGNPDDPLAELLAGLSGLSCLHLLNDTQSVRVGDVSLILAEYNHLCAAVLSKEP